MFENDLFTRFSSSYWLLLCLFLAVIVLTSALTAGIFKKNQNRKIRKRFIHGKVAEKKAAAYFRKHGYRILGTQVKAGSCFYADGRKHSFEVKADMIVQKDGKQFLVEVKTGEDARPGHASTRRQIFEYNHIYKPDKLVLFDADNEKHYLITFDSAATGGVFRTALEKLIAAGAAGLVAGLLLGRYVW
ncbi:MAG: hypothetical protein ACOC36_01495 [Fibrobacterota bacterium]